jgi:hypothetical protein
MGKYIRLESKLQLTAFLLIMETSKLYRQHKEREEKKFSKKLGGPSAGSSHSRLLLEYEIKS